MITISKKNFQGHTAAVVMVQVMTDSLRVASSDRNEVVCIWLADNGNMLLSFRGINPGAQLASNMRYAASVNTPNTMKIWSLIKEDEKFLISHSEEITCFIMTIDSSHLITGSKDMSLKVWQVLGGKLSQVLIGHTDTVTCVAISISDRSTVVSGSYDGNLIVWDINTGADLHTLSAHLSFISCVKLSGDGTLTISGKKKCVTI